MTVIKSLAFLNKNKLKSLNSFVESELDFSAFYPFPVDFLHQFLPLKFKFLNESFVAIENKKVRGLITVNKTETNRIKITRLLLDKNSFEIGKLLVNCVLTIFASAGGESFYVIADKLNTPLITMFTQGCGFKPTAVETVYKICREEIFSDKCDVNFENIYKISLKDAKKAAGLINSTICSYHRAYFYIKSSTLIKRSLTQGGGYIFLDPIQNKIAAYFKISKLNISDYSLEFVVSPAYEGYCADLIEYTKMRLMRDRNFKSLYIKLRSYYSNYKELADILGFEYKNVRENAILTKNFFAAKKQEFAFEKMIFNDATPAF